MWAVSRSLLSSSHECEDQPVPSSQLPGLHSPTLRSFTVSREGSACARPRAGWERCRRPAPARGGQATMFCTSNTRGCGEAWDVIHPPSRKGVCGCKDESSSSHTCLSPWQEEGFGISVLFTLHDLQDWFVFLISVFSKAAGPLWL